MVALVGEVSLFIGQNFEKKTNLKIVFASGFYNLTLMFARVSYTQSDSYGCKGELYSNLIVKLVIGGEKA